MNRIIPFCLLVGLIMVGLAGCGSNAAQEIAAAEVALTAAERLALAYATQPACPAPAGVLVCSDRAIVAKIKLADTVAYTAVKSAQTGTVTPAAAMAAVAALSSLIPSK